MVRDGVDMSVMWGKGLFVLVVGVNTIGAWVLLVVDIMGWVWMGMVVEIMQGTTWKGWLHSCGCQCTSCVRGGDMVGWMLSQIFVWQNRHRNGNTLVPVTTVAARCAAAPPE